MTVQGRVARVLVVDDDLAIRTLLGAALQLQNFECETVPDGVGAIQALSRSHWDAILLDLLLPQTNGFEVIRHIKANRPDMMKRTIVMTAASPLTLRDFEDGRLVWRVFAKPFDLSELLESISTCVRFHGTDAPRSLAARVTEPGAGAG